MVIFFYMHVRTKLNGLFYTGSRIKLFRNIVRFTDVKSETYITLSLDRNYMFLFLYSYTEIWFSYIEVSSVYI